MTTASSHALVRLVERNPSISGSRDRRRARRRRRSSSTRRSSRTGPTPTSRRSRRRSTVSTSSPAAWRARSGRAGSSHAIASRSPSCPASTSTAASASARPTSSRRSGTSRPGRSTSARSSSTRRSSAHSATRNALELLTGARLICIDEFELDDPGDTMLMTRFLGELMAGGTRVAATSNTPPNALGEGRFAASDFLREIQALSANFETLRIDGLDYRRRDTEGRAEALGDDAAVVHAAEALAAARPPRLARRVRRAHRPPRHGASVEVHQAHRRASRSSPSRACTC